MLGPITVIFLILVVLGLIPASVGRSIGRSYVFWWVYGTFLFPIAILHILILKYGGGSKKCMYCGKLNRVSAPTCIRCGYEFIELS